MNKKARERGAAEPGPQFGDPPPALRPALPAGPAFTGRRQATQLTFDCCRGGTFAPSAAGRTGQRTARPGNIPAFYVFLINVRNSVKIGRESNNVSSPTVQCQIVYDFEILRKML